jgi:hypothetical protein
MHGVDPAKLSDRLQELIDGPSKSKIVLGERNEINNCHRLCRANRPQSLNTEEREWGSPHTSSSQSRWEYVLPRISMVAFIIYRSIGSGKSERLCLLLRPSTNGGVLFQGNRPRRPHPAEPALNANPGLKLAKVVQFPE